MSIWPPDRGERFSEKLPETTKPEGPGYMPLYCAAQWIATQGGRIEFNPRDVRVWKSAYAELLPRIASEEVMTTGIRKHEREKLGGHLFASCRVDLSTPKTSTAGRRRGSGRTAVDVRRCSSEQRRCESACRLGLSDGNQASQSQPGNSPHLFGRRDCPATEQLWRLSTPPNIHRPPNCPRMQHHLAAAQYFFDSGGGFGAWRQAFTSLQALDRRPRKAKASKPKEIAQTNILKVGIKKQRRLSVLAIAP